jgi:ubiquinone/menaquinone biosynthesis C-methylase UbiE
MSRASPFDSGTSKVATQEQWDRHGHGWDANATLIRSWLREATDAMLAMAEIRLGARVLDVAAGAGDQTLDIARRVGPAGSVLATDLSPAMLTLAAKNAERCGLGNVEVKVADGEDLQVSAGNFDAAICRLGLMLFPDPERGLSQMYGALRSGGTACTMVFSVPDANPCIKILMSTALRHAGLPPRDPYQAGGLLSLGKPGLIDELFKAAGFSRVATTKVMATFRLPSVDDYLAFVRTSASPILQLMDRLDETATRAAWADIRNELRAFDSPGGWEGPNELLLTAGRKQ